MDLCVRVNSLLSASSISVQFLLLCIPPWSNFLHNFIPVSHLCFKFVYWSTMYLCLIHLRVPVINFCICMIPVLSIKCYAISCLMQVIDPANGPIEVSLCLCPGVLLRSADKVGRPFCCCVVFSFLFIFFSFISFPLSAFCDFSAIFHRISLIFGQLVDDNL